MRTVWRPGEEVQTPDGTGVVNTAVYSTLKTQPGTIGYWVQYDENDVAFYPKERVQWLPTNVGPCPCDCNHGGLCGGCGHAGCGRKSMPGTP
jgi:hypothetical protein